MKIKIDYKKCSWKNGKCECGCNCSSGGSHSCNGCVESCPVGAIKRKEKVMIDDRKCIGCGACVEACPNKALSMTN